MAALINRFYHQGRTA